VTIAPPNTSPCWAGHWCAPDPRESLWALSAASRTVNALPRLHPWRLGDTKGSLRTLIWAASPAAEPGMAVLTQTARPPSLPVGDSPAALDARSWLTDGYSQSSGLFVSVVSAVAEEVATELSDRLLSGNRGLSDRERSSAGDGSGEPRWLGGMARLSGSWLPALAVLPRNRRDFDDPGTRWSTESVDFAARHTVHADNTRYAADVLAPHVMALMLDVVPSGAAATIAGDAIHVWVQHSSESANQHGLVRQLVRAAHRLAEAIPSFVLVDHPDRSREVEVELADKAAAAASYRRQRQLGRSTDPTLQRIYDRARAEWEAGNVSSST
jgi:hypothetical protein